MSDRAAEARAEAERLMNDFYDTWGHAGTTEEVEWEKGFHSGFDGGVEWADANTKPHTITLDELIAAADEFTARGARGDWVSTEDMLTSALGVLGIEVTDDE